MKVALSDNDCLELLRNLQEMVREYDQRAFFYLSDRKPQVQRPPELLLSFLDQLIEFMREHSREGGDTALSQLNRYIEGERGEAIERITLNLSAVDRQLYRIDSEAIDLSRLPDRKGFIDEMSGIREAILSELGDRGSKQE